MWISDRLARIDLLRPELPEALGVMPSPSKSPMLAANQHLYLCMCHFPILMAKIAASASASLWRAERGDKGSKNTNSPPPKKKKKQARKSPKARRKSTVCKLGGIWKIGDLLLKGFPLELLENRRAWEHQKLPASRQKSGLFWASPFTVHPICRVKAPEFPEFPKN